MKQIVALITAGFATATLIHHPVWIGATVFGFCWFLEVVIGEHKDSK